MTRVETPERHSSEPLRKSSSGYSEAYTSVVEVRMLTRLSGQQLKWRHVCLEHATTGRRVGMTKEHKLTAQAMEILQPRTESDNALH